MTGLRCFARRTVGMLTLRLSEVFHHNAERIIEWITEWVKVPFEGSSIDYGDRSN